MAFKRNWLIPAVMFILAFLLYGNTIRNGYNLDDTYVTQNNPKVQKGFAGIPEIFTSRYVDEEGNSFGYRPIAMATFAVEHDLWGQNPHVSHLVNVLIYWLILVLLFFTLRKVFQHTHLLLVLIIVLLFAAHPIHTEAVASLKNRETLLSFLFSVVSLRWFLQWTDKKRIWPFLCGTLFFLLAVLSKQDAITFIAVIPLAIFYYSSLTVPLPKPQWKIPRVSWSTLKIILWIIIPLVILGVAGILVYKLPDAYLPPQNKVLYNFENPQFVADPEYPTSPLAFYTLLFYLQKLLWPHPLGFYYGYKMIPEVSWASPEVIFSLIFHIGLLIFALWKLPKKHMLSFAILYYLITISVFTNIVIKIPGIVGERMAFFPSLGFCIALQYLLFKLTGIDVNTERISKKKMVWLSLFMLIILIPYSIKTITRNSQWKDYLTLFSHDIDYLANSAKANNTYANQLLKEAYNNDVINPPPEVQQEYLELAVKHLKRTVEIDSTYKFAWNNLGYITYQHLDKKAEGISYMEKAVQIDPDYEQAHFNLGYAFKQQRNFEQSIWHFQEAQRIDSGKMLYYTEEADTWFQYGNQENALITYRKASELDSLSDLPFIGMGNIYWLSNDTVNAINCWEEAFKRNPRNLDVCLNLWGYYNGKEDVRADSYKSKIIKLQRQGH